MFETLDGDPRISIRTAAWFINRWERVFVSEYWIGFVSDDVRAAVCDAVWHLVREAERVDRERSAARLAELRKGLRL